MCRNYYSNRNYLSGTIPLYCCTGTTCTGTTGPKRRPDRKSLVKYIDYSFYESESYYTYRPYDTVAGRGSHGHDVHAGYLP